MSGELRTSRYDQKRLNEHMKTRQDRDRLLAACKLAKAMLSGDIEPGTPAKQAVDLLFEAIRLAEKEE